MRKRFEQQLELGIRPISEVELRLKSRHSLVNALRALQYVFVTPALSEQIFEVLERKIQGDKKATGRWGMDLWEILVLGVVRLNLDADYDDIHDLANEHESLRGILGVGRSDFRPGKSYELQTIKDNVRLLDEETLHELSHIIVEGSHGFIKKKEGISTLNLQTKADSFVVESAIHFPTDLNLLHDALRKSAELIGYFQSQKWSVVGCRQWKQWARKSSSAYRSAAEIHRKKGKNYQERLGVATQHYLSTSRTILTKVKKGYAELLEHQLIKEDSVEENRLKKLGYFIQMLEKHIDLVHRRIILGEQIPSEEKVYSLFEPHVEWNSKGKAGKLVELGHNTLVITDQYGFILYGQVYEKQVDKQMTIGIGNALEKRYGATANLESISFDKNFYSQPAEKSLEKKFGMVILPKAGQKSKRELEKEGLPAYQELKRAHAQIEGNINELEQHGLNTCPDKGIAGFKRYVAYGMLSYNLSKLGKMLNEQTRQEQKKARKRAKRKAQRTILRSAA